MDDDKRIPYFIVESYLQCKSDLMDIDGRR